MKVTTPTWFTFRVLLTVCMMLAGIVILFHFLEGTSLGCLGLIALILLAGISYGSANISSGFFVKTISNGNTLKKEISLTFDDGPHEEITSQILDLLASHHASATFFCIGRHIAGKEPLLKRMVREGHQVANHTWSHSYYWGFFSANKMKEELKKTEIAISSVIGEKPKLFRPPFGVTTPNVKRAVTDLKYDVIGWSVRSLDAVLSDEEKIFARVTRQLKPGDIVLFHDVQPRTVRVLERFLEYIKKHDFTVVPLDKLINEKPYA